MKEKQVKRNVRLREIFDTVAEDYESIGPNYFSYFGKELVKKSGLKEESKVLDIACGRGASMLESCKIVKGKGLVIGIDFSSKMVDYLNETLKSKELDRNYALQMDAEKLDFRDYNFDFVFCGLSVPFFSEPIKAIEEMYRVLNINGTLAISTWEKRKDKGVIEKAYDQLFPVSKNNPPRNNRPFDFSTNEGVRDILRDAGFKHIKVESITQDFYYTSKDEWWHEQWHNASRGLFERLNHQDPKLLDKFKAFAFKELDQYQSDKGIKFSPNVLISYGKKI